MSSQELSTKHQLSLTSLKGIRDKDVVKGDIIKSNPYFRQHSTYRSDHNTILPTSVYNQNARVINRLRQKNHTGANVHQLIPANSNFQYFRIPGHPMTWSSPDLQVTRLHAANSFQPFIPAASNATRSISNAHFSRLTPSQVLFIPPSNAVLSQAQSQTMLSPLSSTIAGIENLHAFGASVASFLSSRDMVESFAKFAQNLLRLSTSNQPDKILPSLTSAVIGTKSFIIPSNGDTAASNGTPSSIFNFQQVFTELAKKDFPIRDIGNGTFYENETEIFLNTLPEEQRSLLQAAIQTGELDTHTLRSTIGNIGNKRKQNEGKLLEWIQENRKRTADEVPVSTVKLPYYGQYCGSFVGQTVESSRFNAAGALWAVDNRRFIVSKFHFNPGTSLIENVTFWVGPYERTSNSVTDMTPNANGFYLKPEPINFTTFYKPDIQIVEARTRSTSTLRIERNNFHTELSDKDTVQIFDRYMETKENDNNSGTKEIINARSASNKDNNMEALGWYAGFQPLLLTLPDNKGIKTINWFALWDHKRQSVIAYVLIPNGPAFKIPAVVQLRGLTPNNPYNVKSGYIKILDTKTIEINKFYYRSNGLAAWFVVGKDILPNSNGNIVPIYDRVNNIFDCDSLSDYMNETIILKLPGHLDIKDVFWFSVFSMERSLSLSHLYFPYNDMHLPPDLTDISVR
ncbi:unnamed protein product [Cercopithifilaria johnstoni]|uniref:DM13 domain-containing protein n=1 Tax=Cercopithifilaria johnstoni TaxID=2874296 RepID=A0A8J2LZC2_9BILA|nr:unnamed protein product [Cercopithifilaria johnstoni]